MVSCSSCGAPRPLASSKSPCGQCGAAGTQREPARAADEIEPDQDVAFLMNSDSPTAHTAHGVGARQSGAPLAALGSAATIPAPSFETEPVVLAHALEGRSDARLLAQYGEPPGHWMLTAFYALRVIRRSAELRRSLVVRTAEATRAAAEVTDALVSLAERAQPLAACETKYDQTLEALRGAEERLRSRDRVLAAEQDQQAARLSSIDTRLAKFESDLARAQAEERAAASELVSRRATLARHESQGRRDTDPPRPRAASGTRE